MFIWSRVFPRNVFLEVAASPPGPSLLLDLAILLGLGFLAFRRHVAAAYALVLYQAANVRLAFAEASQPVDVFLPLVVALLYAVGAYHLRRARGQLTWLGRAATAAAAVALLLLALNAKVKTPIDRIVQESETRLLTVPGLRERFESEPDPASAKELGRKLAVKGARRLSGAQLVERARLFGVILSQPDDHNCAEQFRGGRGDITQALNKLDEKTLRAWFELAFAAMVAEHLNSPASQADPPEQEISDAWMKLQRALPTEDSEKLLRLFNEGGDNVGGLSDSNVCWIFRTLVTNMPRLDPETQQVFARALVAEGP